MNAYHNQLAMKIERTGKQGMDKKYPYKPEDPQFVPTGTRKHILFALGEVLADGLAEYGYVKTPWIGEFYVTKYIPTTPSIDHHASKKTGKTVYHYNRETGGFSVDIRWHLAFQRSSWKFKMHRGSRRKHFVKKILEKGTAHLAAQ